VSGGEVVIVMACLYVAMWAVPPETAARWYCEKRDALRAWWARHYQAESGRWPGPPPDGYAFPGEPARATLPGREFVTVSCVEHGAHEFPKWSRWFDLARSGAVVPSSVGCPVRLEKDGEERLLRAIFGGECKTEQIPGGGTRYTLTNPLHRPAKRPDPRPHPGSGTGVQRRNPYAPGLKIPDELAALANAHTLPFWRCACGKIVATGRPWERHQRGHVGVH
jgi:hypothetical protein